MTVFEIVDSCTSIAVTQNYLRCSLSDEILLTNDALSPHCHLPFCPVLQCFRAKHTRLAKIIVCKLLVPCDSEPESETVKCYRLQFRLRLQVKRSTPTDFNTGIDSVSAALLKGMMFGLLQLYQFRAAARDA